MWFSIWDNYQTQKCEPWRTFWCKLMRVFEQLLWFLSNGFSKTWNLEHFLILSFKCRVCVGTHEMWKIQETKTKLWWHPERPEEDTVDLFWRAAVEVYCLTHVEIASTILWVTDDSCACYSQDQLAFCSHKHRKQFLSLPIYIKNVRFKILLT